MSNLKKESGAALVLTLMIITLLLLFVMALFYQITNTSKQVTSMESEIDAQLVAEMGIDYYRSLINNYDSEEQSIEEFIEDLPSTFKLELDDNHYYEIKATIPDPDERASQYIINFTSSGIAFRHVKTLDDRIIINIEGRE